jgi:hypothetical protein
LSSTIELNWLAPLSSAVLMLAVGVFVLARFFRNRLRESLLWGFALISYGSSHLMEFAFMYPLIAQNSVTYFIRQAFVAIMLVLFYSGCTVILTRRTVFTYVSALLFFVAQVPLLFYFDFILVDFTLSSTIHIISFVIPFSVFFVAFFLLYYSSSRRVGSLLIAIAWLVYALIVPFYFLWRSTPLLPFWFVLRLVSEIPLFLGFVALAYTKRKTE